CFSAACWPRLWKSASTWDRPANRRPTLHSKATTGDRGTVTSYWPHDAAYPWPGTAQHLAIHHQQKEQHPMNIRTVFTVTTAVEVIGVLWTRAGGEARACSLGGQHWRDFAVWSADGQLVAVVKDGELISPGAYTYSPAA